jgi:hypothetical protein
MSAQYSSKNSGFKRRATKEKAAPKTQSIHQ